MILNLFDSIYDRDPPESQFDRSHQTTRRSQQTVTSICELNQIFANQHRMSSTRSSLKSINRTIPSINAGINQFNILFFFRKQTKSFNPSKLNFHLQTNETLKLKILEVKAITRIFTFKLNNDLSV